MKKIAIVSFRGEMPCFVHALLNVWNYHERGYEVALIVEGASAARIEDIASSPQGGLWKKIREAGLIRSVCKACAAQMGTLSEAEAQGLPIDAALSGHSDLEVFTAAGFEIILF
ncbi:MAG: cytoplasmic protein [Firmicutes bacterium]|nr:cytoplasmic protein [Bacillota bacterium]